MTPSGNQPHGSGKSLMNGGLNRKNTYTWSIFHCHVFTEGYCSICLATFYWDIPIHRPETKALCMVGISNQAVPGKAIDFKDGEFP